MLFLKCFLVQEGKCLESGKKYGHCFGFRLLHHYNEFELQKAVANIGPVAVGIHVVDNGTFVHYNEGDTHTHTDSFYRH